jgi:hypothetical protein
LPYRAYRLARSRHDPYVSVGLHGFSSNTGPRILTNAGSSSHELRLLFRVLYSVPALSSKASSTFPGISFSFATSVQQVHFTMGFQPHLRSALSVLHALDGLLLFAPWRLVSSSCHVRDSLFRGFPRQSAGLTFISPSPHAVSDVLLRPSCPARARECRPVFRVLIRLPVRCAQQTFYRLPRPVPLLSFHTPAGDSPNTLVTPSRPLHS